MYVPPFGANVIPTTCISYSIFAPALLSVIIIFALPTFCGITVTSVPLTVTLAIVSSFDFADIVPLFIPDTWIFLLSPTVVIPFVFSNVNFTIFIVIFACAPPFDSVAIIVVSPAFIPVTLSFSIDT